MPDRKPDDAEQEMLRHELSMAIEELQIMQEELQAAHDELGRRNQTYSSNHVSEVWPSDSVRTGSAGPACDVASL
jgi:hypothetical protein